jgi:CubicO group peptidase (beta-lactamase class C family)
VAATERCPWRQRLVKGEVHDENAFCLGGEAGHAGLFGTAEAVETLLGALLAAWHGRQGRGAFSPEIVRRFLAPPADGGRALGFDVPTPGASSSGRWFSPFTVGHLGFTGTSFWMDLERQIIVVLLTNRVHPSRANERIRGFRPLLHDAVMGLLLKG